MAARPDKPGARGVHRHLSQWPQAWMVPDSLPSKTTLQPDSLLQGSATGTWQSASATWNGCCQRWSDLTHQLTHTTDTGLRGGLRASPDPAQAPSAAPWPAQGLTHAVRLALQTWWQHRDDFRGIQRRGMARDASWDLAAQQYEQATGPFTPGLNTHPGEQVSQPQAPAVPRPSTAPARPVSTAGHCPAASAAAAPGPRTPPARRCTVAGLAPMQG
ncbi:glyco_transf_5 domain-containing protein [Haematococcus lacustris]|uniref:Glyco_transf_5 domain-containing protein n=1 Tax=Haematococcus lacustris TaxID=44745 RepID=A0A699YP79_HAELA|nr:glyco_transf_5 domain-containing protein [Haematococcus lacustris]